jgi:transposase
MRRVIGMDIHRTFGEVVFWEDGRLRSAGRVDMTRSGLEGFGRTLRADDEVVIEATGNAMAVVRVLGPHVARVIVANPLQVKAIAHARIKTDKIDAGVLASLRAADFLPEIWLPDMETERLRRLVARRNQVVRHRTRIKNEVHSILHTHLIPQCPHADLFGRLGRAWLGRQPLPADELAAIDRHLRELDRLGEDLTGLDREVAQATIGDPAVKRLLTISGINLTVAVGLMAAIGDVRRFASPQKLVSYLGLNPRVRQSGLGLAQYGPHQQAGPLTRTRDAGRGGLGGRQGSGTVARLLPAHPRPARSPDRRRGHGPQGRRAVLAPADQGGGLSLDASGARRPQGPSHGTPSRTAGQEGEQARSGLYLQCQGATRP